jgi:EmrB/QacA subfamily drug resistance transporter
MDKRLDQEISKEIEKQIEIQIDAQKDKETGDQIGTLQKWLILFSVSVSIFMATLDGSIVNIALPVIARELTASISSVQWVVTSYLLTISVLLLVWGKISDMYGKKKIFLFGFIIFTLGSVMCGYSQNLGFLVFSRVVQAVGASAMMALSQGIVTATFPPQERGRALGINGTTVAIGTLVGPSLGGVLVHMSGWQTIFFINIPVGIIGCIMTVLIIPEFRERTENSKFDVKGSLLLAFCIMFLFLGLLFLQDNIITLYTFLPLLSIAIILTIYFLKYEMRAANPLLELSLFRSHVFSLGIVSAFLSFVAAFSTNLFIPFYLQYILGFNTLRAGLLISFNPATLAIFAPISGWLSDKISYKPLTAIGLSLNTIAYLIFTTVNSATPPAKIALLMALLGFGSAMFQSPNTSSIMGSVKRNQLGVAGGMNALFRNLGMVSGATLSVLLFNAITKMDVNSFAGIMTGSTAVSFMKGFRAVLIFAALSCFMSTLFCFSRSVGLWQKKLTPQKERE